MSIIAIAAEPDHTPGGALGPWYDDEKLKEALAARGHKVTIISWEESGIDLFQFDSVFVSTTWNACDHPQEFVKWLDRIESDGRKRLINSRKVIDDGFIKYRYLSVLLDFFGDTVDHGKSGYITPSEFYIDGDPPHKRVKSLNGRVLSDILAELDINSRWRESDIVIKPVISADGKNTFVYNRTGNALSVDEEKRSQFVIKGMKIAQAAFSNLANDRSRGGAILQPYMRGIEEGELSLTFFKRRCSHAIQKPRLFKGDGSTRRRALRLTDLPYKALEFSHDLIAYMDNYYGENEIVRSRIDLIHEDGTPVLCEFECVEPNTNIRIIADQLGTSIADPIFQQYAGVIEARTKFLEAHSIR